MKTGLLPPDRARIARAPQLRGHAFAASPPPAKVDRAAIRFDPGLYQNDIIPDCTAAMLANIIGWTGALRGWQPYINPVNVASFYARSIGKPGASIADLEATEGAMMLDVLSLQATTGFDVGQQVPYAGNFGVLLRDRISVAQAIARLGHSAFGVELSERDMELPPVWDVQPGRDDGPIIARHAIFGVDYTGLGDNDRVRVATWGRWQPATWPWLNARLLEAYALVYRQLDPVDADVLKSDLVAMTTGSSVA